jgi:DNA-directed RNA polymerase specialized sigma24 family protein
MSTTLVESLPDLLPAMLPKLRAFALRLCGNCYDAEDLLRRSCVRGLERTHPAAARHGALELDVFDRSVDLDQ